MGKNKNGLQRLLKLTAAAAGVMYAGSKLRFYLATVRNLLKTDTGYFYNWKFGSMYYTVSGEGSPVVMVHDLRPDCSGCEWKDLAVRISQKHRVYVLDLPGYGRSGKKNAIYTNYYYARAVNAFVENVIGDAADVISSGRASSAVIAAKFNRPDNFEKMIFINPESSEHMYRGTDRVSHLLSGLIEMPLVGTFIYTCFVSRRMIAAKFFHEYFSGAGRVSDSMISRFTEAAHLGGSGARFTLSSHIAGYDACDAMAYLRKMKCKALIIGGRDLPDIDRIIKEYKEADPAITSHLIRSTKAMPHMEAPSAVGKVCCDYLRQDA